jgi:hypothetical protein
MTTDLSREQLLARRATDYLAQGLCDEAGQLHAELTGLGAFAVSTQFDETAVSPQELAFTLEMLKQVLDMSEGDGQAANARFTAARQDTLEHVSRLLTQPNHIAVLGWIQECTPFIQTEADIQAFVKFFQSVLQQYTALQAIKHANQGA